MLPTPTDDDSGWAFHQVLNTQGWNAYRNKFRVPVELGPMDELPPLDTDAEVIASHRPRYGVEMEHDYEAGGSASQTVDGFVSALFGAPPPATYPTTWEQDPWELCTGPVDTGSVGPFESWVAGTGTQHMYAESPGEVGQTYDEDTGEDDEDMGEDIGDVAEANTEARAVAPGWQRQSGF